MEGVEGYRKGASYEWKGLRWMAVMELKGWGMRMPSKRGGRGRDGNERNEGVRNDLNKNNSTGWSVHHRIKELTVEGKAEWVER